MAEPRLERAHAAAGRSQLPADLPPRPPGTPLLRAARNVQAVLGQALAARLSPMRAV
jgi:hypothetical protein